MRDYADVAELAYAYGLGPYGVTLGGSTPSVRIFWIKTFFKLNHAGVAQLAERNLAKVDVAGSNPVSRLILSKRTFSKKEKTKYEDNGFSVKESNSYRY